MEEASNKKPNEKVLIITGNTTFGDNIRKSLEMLGYNAMLANDGPTGLKALYDNLPHLVLLDIDLNGFNGYELLEKKNAEPLLMKIPVFLMSPQGQPINMRSVPQGSVKEFIVSVQAEPKDVVDRVNKNFNFVPVVPKANDNVELKKILWIEDDRLIGNILGKKLQSSGFDLTLAKNGEQALQELNKSMPKAILIDLLLPGMSGFDILQQIRANQNFKNVPIMILSNLSKPSDIEKAKSLGAQKFMVKATASLDQIVTEVNFLVNHA